MKQSLEPIHHQTHIGNRDIKPQNIRHNIRGVTPNNMPLSIPKQVDWNDLGLQHLLQDDDYLNALQSGVSAWIAQIRKLTVLPKSTTLPLLDQAAADNNDDNNTLAD